MKRRPLTYLISDGSTKNVESASLVRLVQAAVNAGVDLIQIREKHLTSAQLFALTSKVVAISSNTKTRVLVNDRADVAIAARADGVHLTESSVPVTAIRQRLGAGLLLGVSTHSLDGVIAARGGGADLIVFGPIFPPTSKPALSAPVGVTRLNEAVTAAGPVPVFALGGVGLSNFESCLAVGAAGIAAISLFNHPDRLADICDTLRSY